MPRLRRRTFLVSQQRTFQVLDADDSDEDGVFDIDEEDQSLIHDAAAEADDETTIIIDDATVEEGAEVDTDTETTATFRWKKVCPADMNIPDPVDGLGKVNLKYAELPKPVQVFGDVNDLDSLIEKIVIPQSVLYCRQKGQVFDITKEEFQAFLGINIVMGYHVLPEVRDYWSTSIDLGVPLIANAMSRNRFEEIRRALHFSDNNKAPDKNDPNHDRGWKVRPLIQHFCESFQRAMEPTAQQSVDERIVKFKGQSLMKQYMKDKPIQRGFKHFCRNDSETGYVYKYDLYTGKKAQTEVGLSEHVVLSLVEELEGKNCRVYFDNFYTSPALVKKLKSKGIFSCGTVRSNRKGLPKDLKPNEKMKRGDIERRYCDGISFVKWIDNKAVMMLSSIDSAMATTTCRRRQKGQKEKVAVDCPQMVANYNRGMRGTDIMDQKTGYYAIDRKQPGKYYVRPFWDYLEMGLVNSHIIHEKIRAQEEPTAKKLSLKEFRSSVALSLISGFTSRSRNRPSERQNGVGGQHKIGWAEKHGRCHRCYNSAEKHDRKTYVKCTDCNKYFCCFRQRNCFADHY